MTICKYNPKGDCPRRNGDCHPCQYKPKGILKKLIQKIKECLNG